MNKIISHFIFKYEFKDVSIKSIKAWYQNEINKVLPYFLTFSIIFISCIFIFINFTFERTLFSNILKAALYLALPFSCILSFFSGILISSLIFQKIFKAKNSYNMIANKDIPISLVKSENKIQAGFIINEYFSDKNKLFEQKLNNEDLLEFQEMIKELNLDIDSVKKATLERLKEKGDNVDINIEDLFIIMKRLESEIQTEKERKLNSIVDNIFKE